MPKLKVPITVVYMIGKLDSIQTSVLVDFLIESLSNDSNAKKMPGKTGFIFYH